MKFLQGLSAACLTLMLAQGSVAQSTWEGIKKGVGDAVDTVSDTVSDAAKSVTEEETPAQSRAKIDRMENATMKRLVSGNAGAKALLSESFGYAVFDTRKFSFLVTTGYGVGVAVERGSGKRTYMKMATGGANIGLGGEFFQLVILFEDKGHFQSFVNEGYEAGSSAKAVVGKDSAGAGVQFNDGKAVFQLTEAGLKFTADVTGTKYWKDDKLN